MFREVASAAKTDRTRLRRLLDQLAAGDVLMVTRLDRLAQSSRDLLNTLAAITDRKAGLRSLGDTWADTTAAHGRLMLTVLGGLAEFAGEDRSRAQKRGQRMGRAAAQIDGGTAGRGPPATGAGRDACGTRAQLRRGEEHDFEIDDVWIGRRCERASTGCRAVLSMNATGTLGTLATIPKEVYVAVIAAAASLFAAIVSAVLTLRSQRLQRDIEHMRFAMQKQLDEYKAEQQQVLAETNALTAYRFEARKRLYTECEPIFFHLIEAADFALRKSCDLANPERGNNFVQKKQTLSVGQATGC